MTFLGPPPQSRHRSSSSFLSTNIKIVLAFVLGLGIGVYWKSNSTTKNNNNNIRGSSNNIQIRKVPGRIVQYDDLPIINTSHKDKLGRPVQKKQFLEPFVVPSIAGFSLATILPGQDVSYHEHEDLHEFFYVIEGSATFQTKDGERIVNPGTFLHFAPHEPHGFVVPETASEPLKMYVSAVVPGNLS